MRAEHPSQLDYNGLVCVVRALIEEIKVSLVTANQATGSPRPSAGSEGHGEKLFFYARQTSSAMVPRGLEPRTLRLLAVHSDQLSYETRCVCHCGMLAVFIVQVFRALGSAIAIAAVRARNLHDTLIPRRALWPNG